MPTDKSQYSLRIEEEVLQDVEGFRPGLIIWLTEQNSHCMGLLILNPPQQADHEHVEKFIKVFVKKRKEQNRLIQVYFDAITEKCSPKAHSAAD